MERSAGAVIPGVLMACGENPWTEAEEEALENQLIGQWVWKKFRDGEAYEQTACTFHEDRTCTGASWLPVYSSAAVARWVGSQPQTCPAPGAPGGLGRTTRAPAGIGGPGEQGVSQTGYPSRPRVIVGFQYGSDRRRPSGEDADDGRRVYASMSGDAAGMFDDQRPRLGFGPTTGSGAGRRRVCVWTMDLNLSPEPSRIGVRGPAFKRPMSILAAPGRMDGLKVFTAAFAKSV